MFYRPLALLSLSIDPGGKYSETILVVYIPDGIIVVQDTTKLETSSPPAEVEMLEIFRKCH